jgi:hypothetical protein
MGLEGIVSKRRDFAYRLEKFVWSSSRKIAKEKTKIAMLCERFYDPLKDAVERGDEGVQNLEGGGVTSNRDSSLNIGDPSTQRRVIFQSPLSTRRKSP